jgi:excisionase family DNA binding protein
MIESPARPTLLTIEEVSSTFRHSKASVYRKIGAGEFPAVRLGHSPCSPLRVPQAEVERYLDRHAVTG